MQALCKEKSDVVVVANVRVNMCVRTCNGQSIFGISWSLSGKTRNQKVAFLKREKVIWFLKKINSILEVLANKYQNC